MPEPTVALPWTLRREKESRMNFFFLRKVVQILGFLENKTRYMWRGGPIANPSYVSCSSEAQTLVYLDGDVVGLSTGEFCQAGLKTLNGELTLG